MKNILLIGNGFDLAHGLLTNYNQFLFILQNWKDFYNTYLSICSKTTVLDEDNKFYIYLSDSERIEYNNLNQLGRIIEHNSWIKYYCECGAEIDGWIDFEKEIVPVIELFEYIFDLHYRFIDNRSGSGVNALIAKNKFDSNFLRVANCWKKYIDETDSGFIYVKSPFVSKQYGILKRKILNCLREEFEEFIYAFEIYLVEFVNKKKNIQLLKQINQLHIDKVISFNYTLTEEIYGITGNKVHHIHGKLREVFNTKANNMVLGLNEKENQNMDFIYFVKYFQRIQKKSGVRYKEFVDDFKISSLGYEYREEFILYIYGHSLDETDEDILKYVIGNFDENRKFHLIPNQVIIFYYDNFDYEQKVINLIKLYGRAIVEKCMEDGSFMFIETTSEKCNEM